MAARPRATVGRAALPLFQRAALSGSTAPRKSEVIKETEVPVSVYSPDSKGANTSANGEHFKIPVRRDQAEVPAEEEDKVTPLTSKVYNQMTPTMQKMSVMGKVIIITG
jgi:hypothetical protein